MVGKEHQFTDCIHRKFCSLKILRPCHLERSPSDPAQRESEVESKDPENLSLTMPFRGVLTIPQPAYIVLLFVLSMALAAIAADRDTSHAQAVNKILIVKSTRTMKLMRGDQVLKTYKVALGTEPVGAKQKHGDHKTPEGNYVINAKNAHSQFHLALRISDPNPADRQRARKRGVSPGGDIMIHGLIPQSAWVGARHR